MTYCPLCAYVYVVSLGSIKFAIWKNLFRTKLTDSVLFCKLHHYEKDTMGSEPVVFNVSFGVVLYNREEGGGCYTLGDN